YDFYETQRIDLRLSCPVSRLEPAAKTLHLASGEEMSYTAALIATGASARVLDIPGAAGRRTLAGVHYLRTLGDAQLLHQELHAATRVVVIGAGFLGCEVAASAASLGKHVTLVSRGPLPLLSALGHEMAAVYRDLHTENGTHVVVNAQAR